MQSLRTKNSYTRLILTKIMIWLLNLNVTHLVLHVLIPIQIIVVLVGVKKPKKIIKTISCKRMGTYQPVKQVVMMDLQRMELLKIQTLKKCIMSVQVVMSCVIPVKVKV